MNKFVVLLLAAAISFSCAKEKKSNNGEDDMEKKGPNTAGVEIPGFDIQGHRGARGYYPENTLHGFKIALSQGVTTLEMDAVITKDGEVILSHEPWLSHTICLDPEGNSYSEEEEKEYNIYQMNYEEIQKFNCGALDHPRFPDQKKGTEPKPKLADVIRGVEAYLAKEDKAPVFYNIETKSNPRGDGIYHPKPEEFVDLLVEVVRAGGILDRCIIQSFDIRTLQIAHQKYPEIRLALLVEGSENGINKLDQLGFVPAIYSPNHESLDLPTIKGLQKQNMRVIPWTVNDPEDIDKLMEMGVDGIISDYPDRVVRAYENVSKALSAK